MSGICGIDWITQSYSYGDVWEFVTHHIVAAHLRNSSLLSPYLPLSYDGVTAIP